jgi:hypothetical protein
MIAIGNTDANTSEISSSALNFEKLNAPFSNDKTKQMMKNNGMHMIGGLVKVEIVFAIFNLFIFYNL